MCSLVGGFKVNIKNELFFSDVASVRIWSGYVERVESLILGSVQFNNFHIIMCYVPWTLSSSEFCIEICWNFIDSHYESFRSLDKLKVSDMMSRTLSS